MYDKGDSNNQYMYALKVTMSIKDAIAAGGAVAGCGVRRST